MSIIEQTNVGECVIKISSDGECHEVEAGIATSGDVVRWQGADYYDNYSRAQAAYFAAVSRAKRNLQLSTELANQTQA